MPCDCNLPFSLQKLKDLLQKESSSILEMSIFLLKTKRLFRIGIFLNHWYHAQAAWTIAQVKKKKLLSTKLSKMIAKMIHPINLQQTLKF